MELTFKHKFNVLRDLIERADLSVKVYKSFLDLFDEFSVVLYSLKEENARLIASQRSMDQELRRLRCTVSELTYRLSPKE